MPLLACLLSQEAWTGACKIPLTASPIHLPFLVSVSAPLPLSTSIDIHPSDHVLSQTHLHQHKHLERERTAVPHAMTNDPTSPPNMIMSSLSALPALIHPLSLCEVALSKRQLGQWKHCKRERELLARQTTLSLPPMLLIFHHSLLPNMNTLSPSMTSLLDK
jgi:hypothetical protein